MPILKPLLIGLLTGLVYLCPTVLQAQRIANKCTDDSQCLGVEVCTEGKCKHAMADWRKGIELELRGGIGTCIAREDDCDRGLGHWKPGFGTGLFAGARFIPTFSVGFDFGYFTFRTDENDTNHDGFTRLSNFMVEIRGYTPFGYKRSGFGDIYFKLALGYCWYLNRFEHANDPGGETYTDKLDSPLNIKIGLGTTFFFVQESGVGDLGMGIGMDYLFFIVKRKTEDHHTDDEEVVSPFNTFQLTAHLTWVFPFGRT